MNLTPVSDLMSVGEWWRSEWDIDWKVIEVTPRHAVVKMAGGRSVHHVTATEVQYLERIESATEREP